MPTILRPAPLLLCGVALAGCGPIVSTTAIVHARASLEAAQEARAQELAPYDYTLGVLLLDKAWEEQGYSRYLTSKELADQAARHLTTAERQALSAAAGGEGAIPDEDDDSARGKQSPRK